MNGASPCDERADGVVAQAQVDVAVQRVGVEGDAGRPPPGRGTPTPPTAPVDVGWPSAAGRGGGAAAAAAAAGRPARPGRRASRSISRRPCCGPAGAADSAYWRRCRRALRGLQASAGDFDPLSAACTAAHIGSEIFGYLVPRLSLVRPFAALTASTHAFRSGFGGDLLGLHRLGRRDVGQRGVGGQRVVGAGQAVTSFVEVA